MNWFTKCLLYWLQWRCRHDGLMWLDLLNTQQSGVQADWCCLCGAWRVSLNVQWPKGKSPPLYDYKQWYSPDPVDLYGGRYVKQFLRRGW